MQCPIKGDTPYFTAFQFWMLRRALQEQRKGQKTFPPQFWKKLYTTAIREGPELRMPAEAADTEQKAAPDMSNCNLPHLSSHMVKTLSTWTRPTADDLASLGLESESHEVK